MRRWMQLAAENGDAVVQRKLGVRYRDGQGVPQDYAEAVKWFRRAAERGLAGAQTNLGVMYANGHGVPKDYVIAVKWLNLGVAGGDEPARKNRDAVTAQMTPLQIARSQQLTWVQQIAH